MKYTITDNKLRLPNSYLLATKFPLSTSSYLPLPEIQILWSSLLMQYLIPLFPEKKKKNPIDELTSVARFALQLPD